MQKTTLLIKNVQVYNSYLKRFRPGTVQVCGDRFFHIATGDEPEAAADEVLDGGGAYMIPGMLDIHMHIESSMLTPASFSRCAVADGVTTIVSEPHEIANVCGMRGIEAMIEAAKDAPIDIFYGIPSSVPSTDSGLETTGSTIGFSEMKALMENKDVVCVGEVMNYRGIIRENDLEITKFLAYLRQHHPQFPVEGHCPSLLGENLSSFLFLGIDADHTEHTPEELRARMENGMFMELQEKTVLPELIGYIVENRLFEHCCFVTDDTMADKLARGEYLSAVVRKAMDLGFPVEEAIYCATYSPARRMRLYDRGSIAPGRLADFFLVDDLRELSAKVVYKRGKCVYRKGEQEQSAVTRTFPADFYNTLHLAALSKEQFALPAPVDQGEVTVRVIEVSPHRTQTREGRRTLRVENRRILWQESDCLLAAVFERHGKGGGFSLGLVSGTGMDRGAAATTYFHDHHNLFVLGKNPEDMVLSANRLIAVGGGMVMAEGGTVTAELALPVCGLLSEKSAEDTGRALGTVRHALHNMGYCHRSPIMSLCTLGLPVSPALKLTDKGLVDVGKGEIVPLIVTTS